MKNFVKVSMSYEDAKLFIPSGLVDFIVHVPVPGNELEVGPPRPSSAPHSPCFTTEQTTIRRLTDKVNDCIKRCKDD